MSEVRIYIHPECHTGQIRDASHELLHRSLKIIKNCTDNVCSINWATDPEVVPLKIRSAFDDAIMPCTVREKWNTDEKWVGRFMVIAKTLSYPELVDERLQSILESLPPFRTPANAIFFLSSARERIVGLLSPQAQQNIDILRWASWTYVESRILRKAVFERIYLTKPKPGNIKSFA